MASQADYKLIKNAVLELLVQYFRPEFLNRIDESVVFHALSKAQLIDIAMIQTNSLKQRLLEQNIKLDFSADAIMHIAEIGFDPAYGARPLKRAIQQYVENTLAQKLLMGEFCPGANVLINLSSAGELLIDLDNKSVNKP